VNERAWQSGYAVVFPTKGIGSIPVARSIDNRSFRSPRKPLFSSYRLLLPRSTSDMMFRSIASRGQRKSQRPPDPLAALPCLVSCIGRTVSQRELVAATDWHRHVAARDAAAAAYLTDSMASAVRDFSVITRAERRHALSWSMLPEVSMLQFRNELRNCHDRSRGQAS
jgi:hypothetical protein